MSFHTLSITITFFSPGRMSWMPCTILPLHPNAWMWAPLPAKEKPVINLSFDLTSQGSRFSIQGARAGWEVTVLVVRYRVRGHQSLLPLQGILWLNSLKSSTRIFGMELTCTEKAESCYAALTSLFIAPIAFVQKKLCWFCRGAARFSA